MYSPYDNLIQGAQEELGYGEGWSSKERYLTPGKLMGYGAAGGIGLAGLGAVAMGTRSVYNSYYSNNPGFRSRMDKIRASKLYSEMTSPFSFAAKYTYNPFSTRETFGWEKKLGKALGFQYGMQGRPTATLSASGRQLSSGRYTTVGMSPAVKSSKVFRPPLFMAAFTAMGISSHYQDGAGPEALAIGAASEFMGQVGGLVGAKAGAIAGTALFPVVGTIAGAVIGGLAGGLAGYSAVDTIKWMKHKGRAWTRPDLGGGFRDTAMTQTMRARSLEAIRTSQFNVRSNLGNEAVRLATGM
jgi:hypothetical protein